MSVAEDQVTEMRNRILCALRDYEAKTGNYVREINVENINTDCFDGARPGIRNLTLRIEAPPGKW